jgi:D-alanyl-D-alanine carboxypeptidase/D-alanyl-D-alanine-endopeptidase (penicillin-binding protein 4)
MSPRVAAVVLVATAAMGCGGAKLPAPSPEPSPAALVAPTPAPKSAIDELRAAIDSMVADSRFRSAIWGILIVNPDANDTLYALNAGKLFLPASNMKIVTGSAALVELGPDYQYRTTYAARGKIVRGVLHGNLVVIGRGDPTVSDHMLHDATIPLRAAADSVAAHGIRRITGHVVQGGDAFPDANWGYGWAWDDLNEPYAAGVDELMFNEGFTSVVVRGGAKPGAPATVATAPALTYPTLRNHVHTAAPTGDAPAQPVTVLYDTASGELVVNGTVAPRDSTLALVAYRDPAAAYLHAFASALSARGVALRANAVDRGADSTGALDTLFVMASPPLREIMPALLKPSQNQIAEALLKTVGLEKTGIGSADSGVRVVRDLLISWGAAPDGFVLHDGSGLSRHDYLTPETIVRVLTAMRHDTAFQVFYDGLPIAGVDGTIADRMRGTMAAGNVRAKTGFVDKARSLSGYVTTADGTPLVFSFLCNNWTTSVRDVERVQDEIAARLAAMTLDRR